jgi:hypothetical protein
LQAQPGHHEKTIDSLRFTIEPRAELIDKLQSFRRKRGTIMYDSVGTASDTEAAQMLKYAKELHDALRKRLKEKHRELL